MWFSKTSAAAAACCLLWTATCVSAQPRRHWESGAGHHKHQRRCHGLTPAVQVLGELDCAQARAPCPYCLRSWTLYTASGNVTLHKAIRLPSLGESCPGDSECTGVSAAVQLESGPPRQFTVAFHCVSDAGADTGPARLPQLQW